MSNAVFTLIDSSFTPEDLLGTMSGNAAGISIVSDSVNYIGVDEATSVFESFDFGGQARMNQPGILLTSGDGAPPLENTSSSYTVGHGSDGDAQFDTLAQAAFSGAGSTNDAAILEFAFTVDDPGLNSVSFDLVFGSDEFPEFTDTSFVDIAAVLVNDVNFGLFDGDPEKPLSIVGNNVASGSFLDNSENEFDIEYDGISPRLTVNVPLDGSEVYNVRIGVADTGDTAWDSGLFVSDFSTSNSGAGGLLVNVEADSDGGELLPAGENTATFFNGGPGDDIMTGSTAADIYDLQAGGNNIIQGSPEQLNGDTVLGFDTDDNIFFPDSVFTLDDLTVTQGSAILDVDSTGDGASDATITLEGDFEDTEFGVSQTNEGTEITASETEPEEEPVIPTRFFLGNDVNDIVVTGTFDLRPLPGVSYNNLNIIMDNPEAAVSMANSIANAVTLTLNANASYDYAVNLDTGTVDITNSSTGSLVAALPVDGNTLTTPQVKIGNGAATAITLDPNDSSIDQSTLPEPGALASQMMATDAMLFEENFVEEEMMADSNDDSSGREAVPVDQSRLDSAELVGLADTGQEAFIA